VRIAILEISTLSNCYKGAISVNTYLYIKRHTITGLKYFGKTTKQDPYAYLGSGKLWLRHIKKHGKEFVVTDWVRLFANETELVEFALNFSKENNIVKSTEWANLMDEDGKHGSAKGRIVSAETRAKHSVIHTGKIISPEQRRQISARHKGKTISPEVCRNMAAASPHRKQTIESRANISAAVKHRRVCRLSDRKEMSVSHFSRYSNQF
jgi:hypothetical protein